MAMPVLLILSAPVVGPAQAMDLRLTYTDQDSRPYLTGTGTEIPARPGMAVELVQRSLNRIGVRLQLTRLPGRRLMEEVKAGRQDGILGFLYSNDRARDLVYPMRGGRPDDTRYAARLAHSLYRREGTPVTWDGGRIAGLSNPVAVSSTTLVADLLAGQGVDVVRIESSGQMFGMLALGRVDAVAVLDILGDRQMRSQTQIRIEKLSPPLLVEDFHVPVSRQFYAAHREMVESLWRTIGATREATYAELSPGYLF